jgi:carbamoyltransferase
MIILGLNAFTRDASAALVIDGRVVAAVEEARLTRVPHAGGFPAAAIRACLEIAGVTIADVDRLAVARRPERNMTGPILYALAGRSSYPPELRAALEKAGESFDWKELVARALEVDAGALGFAVHTIEHQLAHAASVFYSSPFEEAAILTVDSVGDYCSTLLARGRGAAIEPIERVLFPHSLGLFFAMISQLLGFDPVAGGAKTMGLAASGGPRFLEEMRTVVLPAKNAAFELAVEWFAHPADGGPVLPVEGEPRTSPLYSRLAVERFGAPRAAGTPIGERERDLAFACQRVLEERLVETAARLKRLSGAEDLVYAGEVAMNCTANRALRRAGIFRSVGVAPVPGDSGTAVGAALEVAVAHGAPRARVALAAQRTDLGPAFGAERVRAALAAREIPFRETADVAAETAAALDSGAIVGWFAGRMEFGPRALGHRSVLADPRRRSSADRLRARLSHREAYRSFGASVPLAEAARFFEDAAPSPFMLDAFRARPEAAQAIPAVLHADGTTRVHTVVRGTNPALHDLLEAFGARTGVPALLNTSWNQDGEPIACTPEDALRSAIRGGLDVLVMDGIMADLRGLAAAPAPASEPAEAGAV